MQSRQRLYSKYQRIKNNCCPKWQSDSKRFYTWYEEQEKTQEQRCAYCDLPGDTEPYYQKHFRDGKRGLTLEVDRKDNTKPYSPSSCVLACYPCNNARSDVFSCKEFRKIGQAIGKVKRSRFTSLM